jgi:uncharacterized membrane protein
MVTSKFNASFRVLLIAIIVLGIFFRFVNLDRKVFWTDEIFTALRASGHTGAETIPVLYTGQDLKFQQIQKYLEPIPGTTMADVIQGIALEEPHLPPLYFLAVRGWADLWGGSRGVLRSFSAVIGVLSLPAMYWIGMELFGSRLTAEMGVGLMAISPFYVLYSQEARAYSLWGLLVLVSSALLLRSLRQSTVLNWGLYAVTVSLGIYTHLFCALVILGHGIYVLLTERLSRKLGAYLLAALCGGATFVPWLLMLIANVAEAEKMVADTTIWQMRFSLPSMMAMWIGNNSRLFFDVGIGSSDDRQAVLPLIPIILACLFLTGYGLYFLFRNTPSRIWLFIATLAGTPTVFYLASDWINGGRISGVPRYSLPIYIAIQLAIAFTLSVNISPASFAGRFPQGMKRYQHPFLWKTLVLVIFSLGVISCGVSMPAKVWWNKGPADTRYVVAGAALINQSDRPLVITGVSLNRAAELGYELNPDVLMQLVAQGNKPRLPPDHPIFVFKPTEALKKELTEMSPRSLSALPGTNDMVYKLE